jgi:hypothetical protein
MEMETIQILLNMFWIILMVVVFSILLFNNSINVFFRKNNEKNKKVPTEKEVC